jgi:hypothetical protein
MASEKPAKNRLAIANAVVVGALLAAGWWFYERFVERDARGRVAIALLKSEAAQKSIAAYHAKSKAFPPDNAAAGVPSKVAEPFIDIWEERTELIFDFQVRDGTLTITFAQDPLAGKTLVLVPKPAEKGLQWSCDGGTVDPRLRPPKCRPRER